MKTGLKKFASITLVIGSLAMLSACSGSKKDAAQRGSTTPVGPNNSLVPVGPENEPVAPIEPIGQPDPVTPVTPVEPVKGEDVVCNPDEPELACDPDIYSDADKKTAVWSFLYKNATTGLYAIAGKSIESLPAIPSNALYPSASHTLLAWITPPADANDSYKLTVYNRLTQKSKELAIAQPGNSATYVGLPSCYQLANKALAYRDASTGYTIVLNAEFEEVIRYNAREFRLSDRVFALKHLAGNGEVSLNFYSIDPEKKNKKILVFGDAYQVQTTDLRVGRGQGGFEVTDKLIVFTQPYGDKGETALVMNTLDNSPLAETHSADISHQKGIAGFQAKGRAIAVTYVEKNKTKGRIYVLNDATELSIIELGAVEKLAVSENLVATVAQKNNARTLEISRIPSVVRAADEDPKLRGYISQSADGITDISLNTNRYAYKVGNDDWTVGAGFGERSPSTVKASWFDFSH